MGIFSKSPHKLKRSKRFRLSFINDSTFNEVWSIKMSQTRVILSVIAIIAAGVCAISSIIVLTPIRTLLPGYLKTTQRQENILNSLRIDSLLTEANINSAFLNNINDILSDNIETIPSETNVPDSATRAIPIDSIINASDNERQFIQQYEDQERFNLSVLAPIVAEGMMFYTPFTSATIDNSDDSSPTQLLIIAPSLSPVSSVYNGTVIDSYYTPSNSNVIIIQHPNDFISIYSGIGETFVSKGDKVITGQRIGITQSKPAGRRHTSAFELWHKGTPLPPLDYIAF